MKTSLNVVQVERLRGYLCGDDGKARGPRAHFGGKNSPFGTDEGKRVLKSEPSSGDVRHQPESPFRLLLQKGTRSLEVRRRRRGDGGFLLFLSPLASARSVRDHISFNGQMAGAEFPEESL